MAKRKSTMLEEVEGKKTLPPEIPVNPDLTSEMLIDIAVNKDSDVWILHSERFPGVIEWAEYDHDDARLVLITNEGRLNDFGLDIKPLMAKYLRKAKTVNVYLVRDSKIQDLTQVPLVVRSTLH